MSHCFPGFHQAGHALCLEQEPLQPLDGGERARSVEVDDADGFYAVDAAQLVPQLDKPGAVQDFRHLNEGELRGGRERPFVDRQERTGGEGA